MPRTVRKQRQTETQPRRRFRIRPAYILLLLVMAFFSFKFVEKSQELQRLSREAAVLRTTNQQTMQDNNHLQRSIRYYHTPQYVEEEARAKLGDTKPGDVSIVTQPKIQRPTQPHPVFVRYVPPDPAWKQWWHAFFG